MEPLHDRAGRGYSAPGGGISATPLPVSAVVITLNEEAVIERCLTSLTGLAAEIMVVDSGSIDSTVNRARKMGAVALEQEWLGYTKQRQIGIARAANDWILVVDADEVVSDALANSIRSLFDEPGLKVTDVFGVDRPKDFLGILMPSPARLRNIVNEIRLFNRRHAGYDTMVTVHERICHSGDAYLLRGPLLHLQGLSLEGEIEKLNKYSTLEADERKRLGHTGSIFSLLVRPAARFGWVYIAKKYYRFGWRGLTHALLRAFWEVASEAKLLAAGRADAGGINQPNSDDVK